MATINRVAHPFLEKWMVEFYPTFAENAVKKMSAPVQNVLVGTHVAVTAATAATGATIGVIGGFVEGYNDFKCVSGSASLLKYPVAGTKSLGYGAVFGVVGGIGAFITPVTVPLGMIGIGAYRLVNP